MRLPHLWPGQGPAASHTPPNRGGGVNTGEWGIHWDALNGATSIHISVVLRTLDAVKGLSWTEGDQGYEAGTAGALADIPDLFAPPGPSKK